MDKFLEIELIRSVIGTPKWMRVIVKTLGLKKLHSKVKQPDNPAIRGMINKVSHLVKMRSLDNG